MPRDRISPAGGLYGSRHLTQFTRTNRWAMMAITELAMRNGATPISTRRVMALGASFVCSVENTKCPVSDACTAISAVSLSRISPTRTVSGSCRNMERRIFANVSS
jgi:hypothetical protein